MASKLGKGLEAIIPGFKESNLYDKVSKKDFLEVDIDKIIVGEYQPRKNFNIEKLKELSESILDKGLIQPLVVAEDRGMYKLIAGERRFRASIMAGIKKIPVIIKNYDEDERLEIALIENLEREDLNPIEEAETYKVLIEKYNLTQEDLSKRVKKSRSYITNMMRLLGLSDTIKSMITLGKISQTKARTLLSVMDENLREKLANLIVKEDLSVKNIEKYIANFSKKNIKKEDKEENIFIQELIKNFHLDNSKFNIKFNDFDKKNGFIKINFTSYKDLLDIMKKIK